MQTGVALHDDLALFLIVVVSAPHQHVRVLLSYESQTHVEDRIYPEGVDVVVDLVDVIPYPTSTCWLSLL